MKALIIIFTILSFVGCGKSQLENQLDGQSHKQLFPIKRINKDSTIKVSKNELIQLIKKGTAIASEKKIKQFSNEEHILVIILLNTKSLYIPEDDKDLKDEYAQLSKELNDLNYAKRVGEIIQWVPNVGMGMYFPELDIHYGGGIRSGWGFFELRK